MYSDRRNVDTETFSGRPCRNGDDRDNIPPQDSWNIPKPPNSGCCTTTFRYSYSSQPNTVPIVRPLSPPPDWL
jgi:hypothetical protein